MNYHDNFVIQTDRQPAFIELLARARRLVKSQADCAFQSADPLRIAVLGTCSIQQFVLVLRLFLYEEHIPAVLYEGEYDSILSDVLNKESAFYAFKPNIVILLPHYTDIKNYPRQLSGEKDIEKILRQYVDMYKKIWENIAHIEGCSLLQANFVIPPLRSLGILETNYLYSRQNFIRLLNLELVRSRPSFVMLVDMDDLSAGMGKNAYFDFKNYFLSKAGFNIKYIDAVVDTFVRHIKALIGKTRKCLVLDLDNTLWGGVIGDDGYDGIMLDPNNPLGEAYLFFQHYIKELKERGVILAVCSKNDENTAKEPFIKNKNMILRLEDIASFKANWEDKAGNIQKIADELNITLDSLVFFDDNPAEREIVRRFLPSVLVIDAPEDPADYAAALDHANPFDWAQLTQEDITRSNSYSENSRRNELKTNFVDYNEYLNALEMRANIGIVKQAHIARFTQLINKSNQFNLRTKRYTESLIETFMHDREKKLIYLELADKFTNYGIISCLILHKRKTLCFIDTWVMSCRVLKRGVEDAAFLSIVEAARVWLCTEILGEYISSQKNTMVKEFYPARGFSPAHSGSYPFLTDVLDQKGVLFSYNALNTPLKTPYIKINNDKEL